ncbi:hypothetical protein NDU88_001908 [Pleurodeles waltl]|uniref:Uncharacterized protein n=1 Tax=Pleurodeles waltl TaxID=8319 RepID=A0AAV7SBQ4_PLEWA|nr:hypothetical protein NDU88_001908 [Pleurodeles waltl]
MTTALRMAAATLEDWGPVEHCVGSGWCPLSAPPRLVVARLMNFKGRDIIVQAARCMEPINYDNSCILLCPDYTLMIQRHWALFLGMKKKLQACFTYSLLFTPKLKVTANHTTYFFMEPADAWNWVEQPYYEPMESSNPLLGQCLTSRQPGSLAGGGAAVMGGDSQRLAR